MSVSEDVLVPEVMSGAETLAWIPGAQGSIPSFAVYGRDDPDAPDMIVGRALYNRDLIPGPVMPAEGCIYIAMEGSDNRHEEYEVLTNPKHCKLVWTQTETGELNPRAVPGGHDKKDGFSYYIGRHKHEGHYVVGKVHPSTHELFIPYNGKEIKYTEYEILVCESE